MEKLLVYSGKVRDVYKMGNNHLLMKASDRVSSFDQHIGIIPGKGELLNKMSEFWFNETKHIIDNHLISTENEFALVKKCTPFKIEVVVRGYITGNTSTSLWTHYEKFQKQQTNLSSLSALNDESFASLYSSPNFKNKVFQYCGIVFPNGLKKNQKLDHPVITPTTKGKVDKPITKKEIISEGYMSETECEFVFKKALELYNFGANLADKVGFILVDTKYEFGKTNDGDIVLIDEVHTCDSSRYWMKDTYPQRFSQGMEPDKLDKDCVRDWVKSVCNPYDDDIPEIPEEIIKKAHDSYEYFYNTITMNSNCFDYTSNLVVILSGSVKDEEHVNRIKKALESKDVKSMSFVASAHKNTMRVINLIEYFETKSNSLIWVTVAGRSNALSGVVAANSNNPVIACPPYSSKMDMMVNLHSTLQCPSNVPVMTILEPQNVALSIKRIFEFKKLTI